MFSQTAEYALRSMAWLALTPETLVPTGDLADATNVPPHYLAKVLQQMAAGGLVTGRRGVGGGYKLSRDPGEITLFDVVSAVTPIERIKNCPTGTPGGALCPLHQAVDSITESVISALEAKTLADLLSQPGQPVPLCTAERRAAPAANGVAAGGPERAAGVVAAARVMTNGSANGVARR